MVDDSAGTDSLRVNRMIQELHRSGGQVRALCNSFFNENSGATERDIVYTVLSLFATDEFTSFSSQFTEFRIRAVRFDVYNTTPSVNNPVIASTFRTSAIGSSPTFTYLQVADGDDAAVVEATGSKQSFYWVARNPLELAFQSMNSGSSGLNALGGLRLAIPAPVSGVSNTAVVARWLVDFRGRY